VNQITPFNFEGNAVRTINGNEAIWFAMTDVAKALNLSNPTVSIKALDDDEVTKFNLGGLSGSTNFISEPGLYKLIGASRKPEAKRFNRWVTHEVLPSIRKEGAYVTPQTAYEWMANPDNMIQFLEKYKSAQQEVKRLHDENEAMQPKADYTDHILANPGLETTSVIAKNYGYSPVSFNRLLHGLGIQYKQGNVWLLYAEYQDKGYTHVEPFPYTDSHGVKQIRNTMKWTQGGQKFLYDFLRRKAIVPKVEQLEEG